MKTSKKTCVNCGITKDIESGVDLFFHVCSGCGTMGEWGQVASKVEILPPISDAILPTKYVEMNPELFFSERNIDEVIAELRNKADSFTPDISTAKGRAQVKSFSAKFSSSKTFLDKKGAELVSGWKEQAKIIDIQRKRFRDTCDELRDYSRLPVTEWEAAEKAREEAERLALAIAEDHGSAIAENILFDREKKVREELAKIEEEAEKKRIAEREAAEETARKEREEQIRRDATAKAEREKEEAEARAKKAEDDRIAAEKKAEKDRQDAAIKAEEDKKAAVAEAERRAREKAEQDEANRLAREKEEREISEKKAANKAHQAKIKKESCRFIKGIHGITQEQAEGVFDSISTGSVPHISVNY